MKYSPALVIDDGTYVYDVTSPWWNDLCSSLPCSMNLTWPGYETQMLRVTLLGQPAVIQVWKGWCQSFFDLPGGIHLPGGVGAEVGIYRIDPARKVPDKFPGVPDWIPHGVVDYLTRRVADIMSAGVGRDNIWWPAPDLVDQRLGVSMAFSEPRTHDVLLSYDTTSYWTCKWMHLAPSYPKWAMKFFQRHVSPPALYNAFDLDFTINGQKYKWAGSKGPIVPVA